MIKSIFTGIIVYFLSLGILRFLIFSHKMIFLKFSKKKKSKEPENKYIFSHIIGVNKKNTVKFKILYYAICITYYLFIFFGIFLLLFLLYSFFYDVNNSLYYFISIIIRSACGITLFFLIIASLTHICDRKKNN